MFNISSSVVFCTSELSTCAPRIQLSMYAREQLRPLVGPALGCCLGPAPISVAVTTSHSVKGQIAAVGPACGDARTFTIDT